VNLIRFPSIWKGLYTGNLSLATIVGITDVDFLVVIVSAQSIEVYHQIYGETIQNLWVKTYGNGMLSHQNLWVKTYGSIEV
jgi:hypothetical protein